MSSPLSSLKKGTRGPIVPGHIPGHRPIPFRHPEYSEDESKLLEEITTSMAASRHKARDPFSVGIVDMDPSSNPSLRPGFSHSDSNTDREQPGLPPPCDRDLMKLMMARLAIMEQKIQQQQQDITGKDRRIKVLEDKLKIMSKARGGNSNNSNGDVDKGQSSTTQGSDRIEELERHCLLLQQQIHEMETFLADYGMVWVGEQDDPEKDIYLDENLSDDARTVQQKRAGLELYDGMETKGEPYFNIDFERLVENIRDLNVIAGEGQKVVHYTADGARLVNQEPVPVTFYANGMLMFEGPFRPYSDPSTTQCVQDFLDGYFPSELQARYPEGVPFAVRDMHAVLFKPAKALDVFSGVGQALGGEDVESRLVSLKLIDEQEEKEKKGGVMEATDKNKHAAAESSASASTASSPPFPPMRVADFLNRLPQSVVRDGKVIDIRTSIGNALAGRGSQSDRQLITVVETPVTKAIQKTVSQGKLVRPNTPRDITTLRIKSETGSHTYIVKLHANETLRDLRKYLDAHRAGEKDASKDYDIVCAYPKKIFTDNAATMEACGLVPNGVLCLQAKKKT